MSALPDFGDWDDGPEGPYTPPEAMRRFYFSFNTGTMTRWGTARAPRSWSKKRIREHGLFAHSADLNISFDVLSLRHVVASAPPFTLIQGGRTTQHKSAEQKEKP